MSNILAFPVPSLDKKVDEMTPPTFLFSTFEDQLVPIENTILFMQALNEKNIPFESHIFQRGTHGLSLGKSLTSSGLKSFVDYDFAKWFDLGISWLHKIIGDYQANRDS
ncbi:alpha/beta hydrolase family protein [Lederbergia citrisecunda]|uniref:alpha/beta hydrolase family protein n=1 Tax=Lederbergia citrisecunda TaxID=2833583 RepID=UPI001F3B2412|nr:prolyl oligopeptidase family serine peptidase [Lederbergia citrisecunda]